MRLPGGGFLAVPPIQLRCFFPVLDGDHHRGLGADRPKHRVVEGGVARAHTAVWLHAGMQVVGRRLPRLRHAGQEGTQGLGLGDATVGDVSICFCRHCRPPLQMENPPSLVSRYSPIPSWPPSRPRPLSCMPPKGAAAAVGLMSLMPTMPKRSASKRRMARPTSRV
jgi:hypothetical protein